MSTRAHLHHLHNSIDNSVSAQDDTDDAARPYLQGPSAEAGAGTPAYAPATFLGQALYLTEPGNATAVSALDIHQGQLGDCFLLSSFGEEALFHPTAISNMIHNNGNGTETVSLYVDRSGRLPTFGSVAFKPIGVTVTNNFAPASVDNGARQDVVGNQKEIWPQVLEKAVAALNGGYTAIANGGYPVLAMEELTGQPASAMSTANLTLATLANYVSAGDLITMDTSSYGALPYGLVNDHAYMFEKLNGSGSAATVQLGNPWGFDQPAAIPVTRLAQSGIVEVDIGHVGQHLIA